MELLQTRTIISKSKNWLIASTFHFCFFVVPQLTDQIQPGISDFMEVCGPNSEMPPTGLQIMYKVVRKCVYSNQMLLVMDKPPKGSARRIGLSSDVFY